MCPASVNAEDLIMDNSDYGSVENEFFSDTNSDEDLNDMNTESDLSTINSRDQNMFGIYNENEHDFVSTNFLFNQNLNQYTQENQEVEDDEADNRVFVKGNNNEVWTNAHSLALLFKFPNVVFARLHDFVFAPDCFENIEFKNIVIIDLHAVHHQSVPKFFKSSTLRIISLHNLSNVDLSIQDSQYAQITEIYLQNCAITANGSFDRFLALKVLEYRSSMGNTTKPILKGLSSLKDLCIDCTHSMYKNMNEFIICPIPTLEYLELIGVVVNLEFEFHKFVPNLKKLYLERVVLSNLQIKDTLSNSLSQIHISNCSIKQVIFQGDSSLSSLQIDECSSMTNLSGIFGNLTKLMIENTGIETLWHLSLPKLTHLTCIRNKTLRFLPQNMLPLVKANCHTNALEWIPLNLTNLKYLNCFSNDLINLPSDMINLKFLDCSENQITRIDTLNFGNLTTIDCKDNPIFKESIDHTRSIHPNVKLTHEPHLIEYSTLRFGQSYDNHFVSRICPSVRSFVADDDVDVVASMSIGTIFSTNLESKNTTANCFDLKELFDYWHQQFMQDLTSQHTGMQKYIVKRSSANLSQPVFKLPIAPFCWLDKQGFCNIRDYKCNILQKINDFSILTSDFSTRTQTVTVYTAVPVKFEWIKMWSKLDDTDAVYFDWNKVLNENTNLGQNDRNILINANQ